MNTLPKSNNLYLKPALASLLAISFGLFGLSQSALAQNAVQQDELNLETANGLPCCNPFFIQISVNQMHTYYFAAEAPRFRAEKS